MEARVSVGFLDAVQLGIGPSVIYLESCLFSRFLRTSSGESARTPRVKIRNTQIGHHIIIGVIIVIIIISIIITVVITRRSSTSNSRGKHACTFLFSEVFFSVQKRFSSFIFFYTSSFQNRRVHQSPRELFRIGETVRATLAAQIFGNIR